MKVFKKGSTTGEILKYILMGGIIIIALSGSRLTPSTFYRAFSKRNKYNDKKFKNAFYYLKKEKLLRIEIKKGEASLSLTKEGFKKAKKYSLDSLKIQRPKKWDKKWRIIIFDIDTRKDDIRAAFRIMIKRLGCVYLQKSVWLYPFDCKKEIELLKDFFGLSEESVRIIVSNDIGNDKKYRKIFKI